MRIIPARAGFTPSRWRAWPWPRDHPRSRGVYRALRALATPASGSSPLARGLPRRRDLPRRRSGIIPARAGFTPAGRVHRLRGQDHPRSRGVYRHRSHRDRHGCGSSPLARGLPSTGIPAAWARGIIPARAGFTDRRGPLPGYPQGSSPLARGLHGVRRRRDGPGGIIPARAGFTGTPSARWG